MQHVSAGKPEIPKLRYSPVSANRMRPSRAVGLARLAAARCPGRVVAEAAQSLTVARTAANAGFGLPSRSMSRRYEVRPLTGQLLSHDWQSVTPHRVSRLTTSRAAIIRVSSRARCGWSERVNRHGRAWASANRSLGFQRNFRCFGHTLNAVTRGRSILRDAEALRDRLGRGVNVIARLVRLDGAGSGHKHGRFCAGNGAD